jgi:hypothetical protein
MKKASLILVALLLVVGMSLSAQGKWTNWGEGIMYPIYKVGDADLTAGWGPLGWAPAGANAGANPALYQQWDFAYDGDNFGFLAELEFNGSDFATALHHFGVYFKPFDMLKVTMGAPRISDYKVGTFIEGKHTGRVMDGDYGALVQVMPMDGLSAGVALYVPNSDPSAFTMDWGKAFGFGASYALPDIATVLAQARLDQEWVEGTVDVKALQGIGLMASLKYDWTAGAEGIFALASAKMAAGPVDVALDAGLMTNAGALSDTMAFAGDLNAQYGINMTWALGATVGYDNGVGLVGSGEGTPGNGLSLFPYVKAMFGDSYLKIGFVYAGGFDAHDSVAAEAAVIAVPVLYVISF